jgi:hypothetical protein
MTWVDVFGCLRVMVAFVALLLAPGYCVGWAIDLLGFRGRGLAERLVWGMALSFAVVPIVVVVVGKYGSVHAACWVVGVLAVGFVGLMVREFRSNPTSGEVPPDPSTRLRAGYGHPVLWLGVVWVVFVIVELVDVGVGSRLYMSVTVFDQGLRTAFVDAVMRTDVPPVNPLYWAGHGAPMRYYYFWYVLTAVAAKMAGATARQAMIASVAWAGFGLAAVVGLYCRHFLGEERWRQTHVSDARPFDKLRAGYGAPRFSRVGIALGLLAVTGLDVLPAVAKAVMRLPTDADLGWWSPDQVTSWMGSVLWVPHHVAGLVCSLVGFLLVWMAKGLGWVQRGVCGVVAGVAFASAFGLSTWVAVAFAMVMAGWVVWVIGFVRESRGRVGVLLVAGAVAVVVLLPYLGELRGEASGVESATGEGSGGAGGEAHLLQFGVRHMIDPDALMVVPWFADMAQEHPGKSDVVAGLVLLGPGYFLELGFFGLVLVAAVRRRRELDEAGRTALVLVAVGLVVATFLRSAVVVNNDFGYRSILIVQFFLLMLGVVWWEGGLGVGGLHPTHRDGAAMNGAPMLRLVMVGMVWIGVAGTVYQVGLLRFYLPVEDKLGRPEVSGLAERTMALRRGLDAMDAKVAKDAVIQFDLNQPGDYFRDAQIMLAGRQIASGQLLCTATFGGDSTRCTEVQTGVARLFAAGGMAADEARSECAALGVSDLVATRWDGVWRDRGGWVWGLPAVVDTGEVRIVDCEVPIK